MINNELVSLYEKLLYLRLVEEKICELYPQQEIRCPVHISIGQEATAVGVCAHLKVEDIVFSSHRSHAHYLAKGGNLKKFLAEIYGKKTGCCQGLGGSMHLADLSVNFMASTSIVGGTIPLAVGTAFASSLKGNSAISVAFFGDAAVEEGVFHESLNFAKLKNLPVLFVCENNLYAVYTSLKERQPARQIKSLAEGHGVETYFADGYDLLDVYTKAGTALQRIREGKGPIFMEIATYRWREHCGPNYDNNLGYRSEEEFLSWKKRDPLPILRQKIIDENFMSTEQLVVCEQKIQKMIDEAVSFAKSSPFPDKEELGKHVYAD